MVYDTVIVGGGIAGLTAAAYLAGSGYSVLVCEKEENIGGLVNSFKYKGFTFDGGIRAVENSGIVIPMLKQLGIDVEFLENKVSVGIEKEVLRLESEDSLPEYQALLSRVFPENRKEIELIIQDIHRIMEYMDILYGIDNPLFLDLKKDTEYLYKTILPWSVKFLLTNGKIQKLKTPIYEYLRAFTQNQSLLDMIAQHFFRKTPAFFALSYFSLYLDYRYPKGGTGSLIDKIYRYILEHNGEIRTKTKITAIDPVLKQATDDKGNQFSYKKLIWAADMKTLYRVADIASVKNSKVSEKIKQQKASLEDMAGCDSVLTLYLTTNLDKSYFESICSAHFFYTPLKQGLGNTGLSILDSNSKNPDRDELLNWLNDFFRLTTYEISVPVMRDESLAPQGKTGLIISTLFDYNLVKYISDAGWYEEFKKLCSETIARVLDQSIYPGLEAQISDMFVSTPLTFESRTGNTDGAITGWAFTNTHIPVVSNTLKISQSVLTPIPDVLQAGQWTYSPAGLPISIMTGKLAADKVKKQLKK